MKKSIIAALFGGALCLLTACGFREEIPAEDGKAIEIYYLNKEETKVVKEAISLTGQNAKERLDELMELLGTQPDNVELKAPISSGFQVKNYYMEELQVVLEVDEGYKKLEPTKEILVRAALVRSLTQLSEVDFVSIKVNEEPLTDLSGNLVGTMTPEMFIDNAGTEISSYEKASLHLYFANEAGNGLVEVNRPKVYNSNISMEKLVVEEILAGPTEDGAYPTVNPDTKIISVNVKDGICYVNFGEAFLTQIYNVSAKVTLYSLTNSLVELSNVNKVQILIDGKSDVTYRDNISLTQIFDRNLELLNQ